MLSNNTISVENAPEQIITKSMLPTNDVVFHCLFGAKGNERITKKFIEKIIGRNIESINLDKNLNLKREYYDEKLGILDVLAKGEDGTNYNIEMQNATSETLPYRILWYWSKLYNGELKIGNTYGELKKTIAIIILNNRMKNLSEIKDKFHTTWNIREETYRDVIFTDYFELHIVELPKYKELKTKENENVWLDFIKEPRGEEVMKKMEREKELKEAKEKWEEIVSDEKLRNMALRHEVAMLDYNTGLEDAWNEGAMVGIEKGKKATNLENAKKMLQEKIDKALIMKITGLTEEELKKL